MGKENEITDRKGKENKSIIINWQIIVLFVMIS